MAEEKECEVDFEKNFSGDLQGRFVVRLPKKISQEVLGESREIAFKRLCSMEKRLKGQNERNYRSFLKKYESLGHMYPVDELKCKNF